MFEIGNKKFKLLNGYILVEPLDERSVLGTPQAETNDEIYDFLFEGMKEQEEERVELKSRFVLCRIEDVAEDVFVIQKNSIVLLPIQVLESLENGGLKNKFITKQNYVMSILSKGGS